MLRYIYADKLHKFPLLARSMFCDRANQFHTRLGWDVKINTVEEERDEYDEMNPLYVIWQLPDGSHGGSMRFLPTVERTMVNDHFPHLLGGGAITSPVIWECTRFCLSRGASGQVAAALILGGSEIMENFGIRHFVGVFDARMVRIYRQIGACPEILGSAGRGRDQIFAGLWEYSSKQKDQILLSSGISQEESKSWFHLSFNERQPETNNQRTQIRSSSQIITSDFEHAPRQQLPRKVAAHVHEINSA